ncbi:flagellar hook-associated protein FlgL [Pigmentibacter sp. JX0631]|uniref:flagellar hook-associated protein FlgL n=1 Tax=Pigmentibacter sp. JX0631 TaxID=2976982 RepID=UPI0024695E5B|nr:flagellar hook-associated protein FlgL [Pigmentibacter sp. JX0631]WGL60545.1 flagellar hook-associated protein FlgL [Pigmentibacter sp. JX0631]
MPVNPRISEQYRYGSTLDRIGTVKNIADDVHETAVSARKLKRISDDPVATIRVLRNRTRISNLDQYRKSLDFGRGYLAKTEDALTSIYESLIRAKELSIQQSNNIYDDASRKAVAEEIRQILNHVIILGNTTYGDKYVFGGFQTTQPPISPDGHYLGDDGYIFIQVDEDSFRPINVSGRMVFDVPGGMEGKRPPLVNILQNMYESLFAWDKDQLHQSMVDLDSAMNSVVTATASLGARRVALEDVSERLDRGESQLHSDNNNLEGADLVKSALDLKRAETALNFTLQASSKMLTPSLLEFLK